MSRTSLRDGQENRREKGRYTLSLHHWFIYMHMGEIVRNRDTAPLRSFMVNQLSLPKCATLTQAPKFKKYVIIPLKNGKWI